MKYDNPEDHEAIRTALNVFLAQKKLKLKTWCDENGVDYLNTHQKLNFRKNISHEWMDELIKKIDPTYFLVKANKTFIITNRHL